MRTFFSFGENMQKKIKRTDSYQPSIQELEHALKVMAKIVVMYGEDYLPIFMRLQRELDSAKEAEKMKSLALELAKSYTKTE